MLIVDTNVLLAAADTADQDHDVCRMLLATASRPFISSPLIVAEACHLIDRQLGAHAETRFLRSIANGDLTIEHLEVGDWARIAELTDHYADLRLGAADASLIVLVERYRADRVATLDHRHFRVVRPRGVEAIELVP